MLRSDLIQILLKKKNWLKEEEVEKIIDGIFGEIKHALTDGHRVELRGFGVLSLKEHKARQGRNPKNGNIVLIPSKKSIHFKMGKDLFNKINQNNNE
jgi:integration host factor subunit beta